MLNPTWDSAAGSSHAWPKIKFRIQWPNMVFIALCDLIDLVGLSQPWSHELGELPTHPQRDQKLVLQPISYQDLIYMF
jgi:hypothetical protein